MPLKICKFKFCNDRVNKSKWTNRVVGLTFNVNELCSNSITLTTIEYLPFMELSKKQLT